MQILCIYQKIWTRLLQSILLCQTLMRTKHAPIANITCYKASFNKHIGIVLWLIPRSVLLLQHDDRFPTRMYACDIVFWPYIIIFASLALDDDSHHCDISHLQSSSCSPVISNGEIFFLFHHLIVLTNIHVLRNYCYAGYYIERSVLAAWSIGKMGRAPFDAESLFSCIRMTEMLFRFYHYSAPLYYF